MSNDSRTQEEKLTHADIEDSYSAGSDNEEDIEEEAEQYKVSKEFKEKVVKYVKIDDLIRKKEQEIRELKEQRKPCESFILEYLDKVGETTIELSSGKLRKNKSETKIPLSQEIIRDAISEKVKDDNEVEAIIALMDTLRPKNVRVNLKRTNARPRKAKAVKDLESNKDSDTNK